MYFSKKLSLFFVTLTGYSFLSSQVDCGPTSTSSIAKGFGLSSSTSMTYDPCYEDTSAPFQQTQDAGGPRPRKCIPDFVNAAFGKNVEVSHSCGESTPTRMCFLSDGTGVGFSYAPHQDPDFRGRSLQQVNSMITSSSESRSSASSLSSPSIFSSEPLGKLESFGNVKGISSSAALDSSSEDDSSGEVGFGESETKFFDEEDYVEEDSPADEGLTASTTISTTTPTTTTTTAPTTSSRPTGAKRSGGQGRKRKGGSRSRVTRGLFLRNGRINRQWLADEPESTCHVCDAQRPRPPTWMTDLNNPSNLTCWESDPLASDSVNVTLTLRLGKRFELTYVSLTFCGQKPDSLAILKSTDFGRTWQPFHFYSSHCKKVYSRPNR
jgi:hypothetical protein